MVLHKVSTSPFSQMDLHACLARIQPTDALLLSQDAVYAVMDSALMPALVDLSAVYILKEDALARAVHVENPHFKLIDYADFVALSLKYAHVMSW